MKGEILLKQHTSYISLHIAFKVIKLSIKKGISTQYTTKLHINIYMIHQESENWINYTMKVKSSIFLTSQLIVEYVG